LGQGGIDRFTVATLAVLVVDLVFGGATQPDAVSTLVARLASLVLLIAAAWRLRKIPLGAPAKAGLWLLAALIAVPVIQCVPLPPSFWEQLPGRRSIILDYAAAGIPAPWLPISLAPYETQDVLPWLVPPGAMFLATLGLRAQGRMAACLVVPVVAIVAVALGLMQVLGGPESVLRFYSVTNPDSAVGFFANRNHEAAFLVAGLALAPLWITFASSSGRVDVRLGILIAVVLQMLLVVGIGVTHSRAGVLIGFPVLLGAGLITLVWAKGASTRRAASGLLAAGLVGAVLVGLFARTALLQRFQEPIATSVRAQTAPAVRHAAELYFPFGSGIGSFDQVYRALEPIGAVTSSYFNHAHDDALELLVETGAFGMAVLGAFLVWWLWVTARLLTRGRGAASHVAACASLTILALLAHSLVDYPLRTTAMASLFALACGLMAASPTAEVTIEISRAGTIRPITSRSGLAIKPPAM